MPNQVVYQTNADYEASYEKLVSSDIMIVEKTEKGLIWFRVKGTRTVFQLSPNGKLQVKWQNPEEKKVLLNIVKNILVSKNDQPLIITPLKQQVWIDMALARLRQDLHHGIHSMETPSLSRSRKSEHIRYGR